MFESFRNPDAWNVGNAVLVFIIMVFIIVVFVTLVFIRGLCAINDLCYLTVTESNCKKGAGLVHISGGGGLGGAANMGAPLLGLHPRMLLRLKSSSPKHRRVSLGQAPPLIQVPHLASSDATNFQSEGSESRFYRNQETSGSVVFL